MEKKEVRKNAGKIISCAPRAFRWSSATAHQTIQKKRYLKFFTAFKDVCNAPKNLKGRLIQDNFMLVHQQKHSRILLKLDISKASVTGTIGESRLD
jgi:predicted ABC-type exoprotein transport system permease subunit